jgi:multidrug efflux pump subunit AcrA (membrane-fusion protein)
MRTSVAFLALGLALAASGCGLHGKPKVARKTRANTVTAGAPELANPDRVVAPGIVEAWGGSVQLSPQESGWIARILVAEGAQVAAGQLLATLDSDVQRAAVDLAAADLAEAQSALDKTLHGSTLEELRQARAEADANRARADLARRDADRAARLAEGHAVASVEVDRTASAARAADSTAQASEARLAALERGSRVEDRTAGRNRVGAARARLAQARANLARREVVAPIAGLILQSRAHGGEFFAVGGAPLFILGDVSRLQVRLEVDEIDASRVGARARCALFADDNSPVAQGVVYRLAPQMGRRGLPIESPTARADVRVREVFVETPGSSGLLPGQRVWGHVVPSHAPATISVSEAPHVP